MLVSKQKHSHRSLVVFHLYLIGPICITRPLEGSLESGTFYLGPLSPLIKCLSEEGQQIIAYYIH